MVRNNSNMAPQRIQIHRRNRKPIIVHLPIREYAPEQRKRERALAAARPSNHTDAFARFDLECEVVEDFGAVLHHTRTHTHTHRAWSQHTVRVLGG